MPRCCLSVPLGWVGALMLILHRGFMQPAAAWGGAGGKHFGEGGWSPAPLGVATARQPSPRVLAAPIPACLSLQHPPRVAAPDVDPPSLLNTTLHTYLALPGTVPGRTGVPCMPPHLSHPPCPPRDTARTKDCTLWELGDMLLSGGPGSPQQVTVPGECAGASACALLHAIVPLSQ